MDYHAENPFFAGGKYRTLRDFVAFNETFAKDEILTFVNETFSVYDDKIAYFFKDASGKLRTFVLDFQDDRPALLRERFAEV